MCFPWAFVIGSRRNVCIFKSFLRAVRDLICFLGSFGAREGNRRSRYGSVRFFNAPDCREDNSHPNSASRSNHGRRRAYAIVRRLFCAIRAFRNDLLNTFEAVSYARPFISWLRTNECQEVAWYLVVNVTRCRARVVGTFSVRIIRNVSSAATRASGLGGTQIIHSRVGPSS